MNSKVVVALASFGVMLGSALLSAQETVDTGEAGRLEAEQAASPPQATTQEREGSSDSRTPARDPSRYQSSEQISEDLSVSFPVDI